MSDYQIRVISYEDVDLEDDQLMTMKDAAKELNVSLYTVISNVNSGRLTEIIDKNRTTKYRRLVLKEEIEDWKKDHPA